MKFALIFETRGMILLSKRSEVELVIFRARAISSLAFLRLKFRVQLFSCAGFLHLRDSTMDEEYDCIVLGTGLKVGFKIAFEEISVLMV